jgi:hypothetical protein
MNERQRIEELNDHARRVFRAETAYAKADAFAASEQARYQAACEAVHAAEAERCKAWAIYQAQFVRFVQDCVHEDPARSAAMAEVLAWFNPRPRETDPDDREILAGVGAATVRLG